jgi:hypothetical protein
LKLASISSIWTGSGFPSRANGAASTHPRLCREEDKLPDGNESSVVPGRALSDVAYFIGETEGLGRNPALARPMSDGSSRGVHETLLGTSKK